MQLCRRTWAIALVGLIATATESTSVRAEPLIGQDSTQQSSSPSAPTAAAVDLTDLSKSDLPLDETPAPATFINSAVGTGSAGRIPLAGQSPQDDASLHKTIKEAVRPVYNELVESGAMETWHDVKETLGLSSHNWDRPGVEGETRTADRPLNPNGFAWQDPAQPVKSAAQAQLDREYDAYLLRQLIDDLKPWALGLVGLYALGYLAKLVFKLMQWKVARRRERRAQHARHHASHHRHDSKREL